jgi:hypothetical protein
MIRTCAKALRGEAETFNVQFNGPTLTFDSMMGLGQERKVDMEKRNEQSTII